MTIEVLNNPPLVEAIFEMTWELQEQSAGINRLLAGILYEKFKEEYPYLESLLDCTPCTVPGSERGWSSRTLLLLELDGWQVA
jgi:uncharacterized protein (TIGR04255 family)